MLPLPIPAFPNTPRPRAGPASTILALLLGAPYLALVGAGAGPTAVFWAMFCSPIAFCTGAAPSRTIAHAFWEGAVHEISYFHAHMRIPFSATV